MYNYKLINKINCSGIAGIGNKTSELELLGIASEPKLHYQVASYQVLRSIIKEILETTCEITGTLT